MFFTVSAFYRGSTRVKLICYKETDSRSVINRLTVIMRCSVDCFGTDSRHQNQNLPPCDWTVTGRDLTRQRPSIRDVNAVKNQTVILPACPSVRRQNFIFYIPEHQTVLTTSESHFCFFKKQLSVLSPVHRYQPVWTALTARVIAARRQTLPPLPL